MKIDKANFWKMTLFLSAFVTTTFAATAAVGQVEGSPERTPATQGYVYWTNNNNGTIGRATITGTDANEKFIKTGYKNGNASLTVNADYIYWTTANGGTATYIGRADLDGKDVNPKFINTAGDNVCGVAVNSTYIYWVGDVGTYIGRANLDGTDVNPEFIEVGTRVCGLAVTKSDIYWANYDDGEIGRANIDGSDPNSDAIDVGSVVGIAIEGDYVYFTSNGGTTIGRVKLNGSDLDTNFITGLNGEQAFLAADSQYIFWANADVSGGYSGTTIGRANIDGSDVNQSFITGAHGPFGIAVTGGDPSADDPGKNHE
jgi:virginiamycin B lyase